ncbi:speckle-type POZ protein-like [Parasteatoda tepidariorum]
MAEVEYSQYIFTWKIKNFLSCYFKYGECIESPYFIMPNLPLEEWNIKLYPKGTDNIIDSADKISLLFRKKGNLNEAITLNVRIEVVDINCCVLMSEERKNCSMVANYVCCPVCFQTFEMLCELLKSWSYDTLTIRCTITQNDTENKILSSVSSEAVTVIDVNRYIFKWDVSNTECFDWSKSMSVPNSAMPASKISLSAPNEGIDIKIQMLNESSIPKSVVFRMIFQSISGARLASKCEVHLFDSLDFWQFPTFVNKKDLCFGNSSPSCCKYTFICECNVTKKSYSSTFNSFTINSFVKSETTMQDETCFNSSLREDFRKLFLNKKYSDVKLKVGEKEFFAHKNVLGIRSPVFSTMFDQDMLENRTGVVDIEDMEEETVQNLLEYIYTDELNDDIDDKSALRLLLAADRYQVLILKDRCISMIMSKLSVENICEVIAVADLINQEHLKSFALSYIFENVSRVLSTPIWFEWVGKNMKLATEIMCELSKHFGREKND